MGTGLQHTDLITKLSGSAHPEAVLRRTISSYPLVYTNDALELATGTSTVGSSPCVCEEELTFCWDDVCCVEEFTSSEEELVEEPGVTGGLGSLFKLQPAKKANIKNVAPRVMRACKAILGYNVWVSKVIMPPKGVFLKSITPVEEYLKTFTKLCCVEFYFRGVVVNII